jgi:hypothetical protein
VECGVRMQTRRRTESLHDRDARTVQGASGKCGGQQHRLVLSHAWIWIVDFMRHIERGARSSGVTVGRTDPYRLFFEVANFSISLIPDLGVHWITLVRSAHAMRLSDSPVLKIRGRRKSLAQRNLSILMVAYSVQIVYSNKVSNDSQPHRASISCISFGEIL